MAPMFQLQVTAHTEASDKQIRRSSVSVGLVQMIDNPKATGGKEDTQIHLVSTIKEAREKTTVRSPLRKRTSKIGILTSTKIHQAWNRLIWNSKLLETVIRFRVKECRLV